MSGLIATSKASEHPSLASILLTGAARGRREAQQDAVALRTPLPLPCRVLVAPLGRGCGATTLALQLTAIISRARGLPALLLSGSSGPRSAADRVRGSRTWPPPGPGAAGTPRVPDPDDDPPGDPDTWPQGVPRVGTTARARELAGTGPDGLMSCLRLPPLNGTETATAQWTGARRALARFFDLVLTETDPLPLATLGAMALVHDVVVLVCPARREDVERGRQRADGLRSGLAGTPCPAHVLHVVVATTANPLVPPLAPGEHMIAFDRHLEGAATGRTTPPGLVGPRAARDMTHLAADVVASCARRLTHRDPAVPAPGSRTTPYREAP